VSTQLQRKVSDSAVSTLPPLRGYNSVCGQGDLKTTPRALLTGPVEKSIGTLVIIEKRDITGLQSRASASYVSTPPEAMWLRVYRVRAGCILAI
jgi:hypothetical protein